MESPRSPITVSTNTPRPVDPTHHRHDHHHVHDEPVLGVERCYAAYPPVVTETKKIGYLRDGKSKTMLLN